MVFGSDVKTQRLRALAFGLLTSVVLMIILWAWSLPSVFTHKRYGHLRLEESTSSPTNELTNDTASHTDLSLDIWNPFGAMKQLRKYNYLLNKNVQPMTADPHNANSITQWWQAASMIAWYLKSPPRYGCRKLGRYGNWAVCQDKQYSVQWPCLVYSIGINFDFSFDDAIGQLGCDVRSFDPSMGRKDHQRSNNIKFYAMGLGSTNTDSYVPRLDSYVTRPQIWKVRTLTAIRHQLGHSDRVIDVLKLDIEAWEWRVLDNIMETNLHKYIRHLLVEYHLFCGGLVPPRDYLLAFQIHARLRKLGFLEYLSNAHSEKLSPVAYNMQGEVLYVNSRFNLTDIQMSDPDADFL